MKYDLTELDRMERQRKDYRPAGISPRLLKVTCGILIAMACAAMAVAELWH